MTDLDFKVYNTLSDLLFRETVERGKAPSEEEVAAALEQFREAFFDHVPEAEHEEEASENLLPIFQEYAFAIDANPNMQTGEFRATHYLSVFLGETTEYSLFDRDYRLMDGGGYDGRVSIAEVLRGVRDDLGAPNAVAHAMDAEELSERTDAVEEVDFEYKKREWANWPTEQGYER